MTFTEKANKIFNQAIRDYHLKDDVLTHLSIILTSVKT